MSKLTRGIDVSYAQGRGIDWANVARHDVNFVIARGGHGEKFDGTFNDHNEGAKSASLLTGCYWFFEADHSPYTQADMFIECIKKTRLRPVIDFETLEGCGPVEAVKSAEKFLVALNSAGYKPILYTCYDFWHSKLGNPSTSMLTTLDLWVAHYGVKVPLIPKPWQSTGWLMWQYDGDGGERLPDGRDSDFVWLAGTPDEIEQGVLSPEGITIEGPKTSRVIANDMVQMWITESLDRMADQTLEDMRNRLDAKRRASDG